MSTGPARAVSEILRPQSDLNDEQSRKLRCSKTAPSQPRVDRFAFQREDGEDAFVNPRQGLVPHESL